MPCVKTYDDSNAKYQRTYKGSQEILKSSPKSYNPRRVSESQTICWAIRAIFTYWCDSVIRYLKSLTKDIAPSLIDVTQQ